MPFILITEWLFTSQRSTNKLAYGVTDEEQDNTVIEMMRMTMKMMPVC